MRKSLFFFWALIACGTSTASQQDMPSQGITLNVPRPILEKWGAETGFMVNEAFIESLRIEITPENRTRLEELYYKQNMKNIIEAKKRLLFGENLSNQTTPQQDTELLDAYIARYMQQNPDADLSEELLDRLENSFLQQKNKNISTKKQGPSLLSFSESLIAQWANEEQQILSVNAPTKSYDQLLHDYVMENNDVTFAGLEASVKVALEKDFVKHVLEKRKARVPKVPSFSCPSLIAVGLPALIGALIVAKLYSSYRDSTNVDSTNRDSLNLKELSST